MHQDDEPSDQPAPRRPGAVRHPTALGGVGLVAGLAIGLLVAAATNSWLGVVAGAAACGLVVAGRSTLLGAGIGLVLAAVGLTAATWFTRWIRGDVPAFLWAGAELWRLPVFAIVGGAVGWVAGLIREVLPSAARLGLRVAGVLVLIGAVAVVAWSIVVPGTRPVHDLELAIAAEEFHGFEVGPEGAFVTRWRGAPLEIPVMFYPDGYVSSTKTFGGAAAPEDWRVDYTETASASADDIAAWYLQQGLQYEFTKMPIEGKATVVGVADPSRHSGMVAVRIATTLFSQDAPSQSGPQSTIIISVHPPSPATKPLE